MGCVGFTAPEPPKGSAIMRSMEAWHVQAAWRWCLQAAAIVLALSIAAGIRAQTQAPQFPSATAEQPSTAGQTVFRSGVTLVTTDVIVRDEDGVFFADLTEDDFTVYEDGIPQEIVSLVLVHGGRVYNQLVPPVPVQEGIVLPPTRPVNDAAGRIFIIFVDDLHIETSKTPHLKYVFGELADTLIHEGDMFGIVSTGPSSISIDLTYDRSLLDSAKDRIRGHGFSPTDMIEVIMDGAQGPSELRWRAHVAFNTAHEIVGRLEEVQNRRKVFIYMSSGYDFNPFEHERVFGRDMMMRDGGLGGSYGGIPDAVTNPFETMQRRGAVFSGADLAMEVAELTKAANRANASFYTVDPRGLVAGPDINYKGPVSAFNKFLFTTQNSLRTLADLTGGMAVVNRNDFENAFKEIDAETSDYYVLGFYSSNPDPTFRTRRLRVEVDRESVEVRSRTHYTYARKSEQSQ